MHEKGLMVPFKGMTPKVHESAFVAPNATLIGDIEIGEDSSVWFGAVIRGDVNFVRIGKRTNIQDLSMLHVTPGSFSLEIGDDVTIGHSVSLHGCKIGDNVLVGIGATVLDGAVIESNSVVAAGALVPEGFTVPSGSIVMGVPAKVKSKLREPGMEMVRENAHHYVELMRVYK